MQNEFSASEASSNYSIQGGVRIKIFLEGVANAIEPKYLTVL
jgi:hypothetical protein